MKAFLGMVLGAALVALSFEAVAADDVKTARDQAKATYNMNRKACAARADDERKDCLRQAKAEYDQQITEVRKMKKARDEEKKAARAQAREAKRHATAHSGGDRSYKESEAASKLAMPGSESQGQEVGNVAPGSGMGNAPTSANSPPKQ